MLATEQSSLLTPLQDRWQEGLGGGFVVIPSVLLLKQSELGLDCEDVVVLANLLVHWWEESRAPFPRTESLAKRMGISRRTVQRRIRQLEEKGFLTRVMSAREEGTGQIAHYDLRQMVEKLKPLGQQALANRESNKARRETKQKARPVEFEEQ